ncbi:MAG TPA: endonuclease/exonuclease/phosphatase family protein [Candidatus Saccharimonadales bacterium]|nr:endonuclease/exonuclease/phosphatase family protein [Candidatus Saccharimonadales bacterium]
MAIELAAWNVAKGLGIDERAPQVLEGIKRLDADVVVLSEAWATDDNTSPDFIHEVIGRTMEFAGRYGYRSYDPVPYKDADTTRHGAPAGFEQYLLVMGRENPAVRWAQPIRLGTRNALSMHVTDPQAHHDVYMIGAHFDDRSEALRLGMASALLKRIDLQRPFVLAGDLNAMHHDARSARFLRSKLAEMAASHLPGDRAKWLGSRLLEMGDGRTMGMLARAGLKEADPKHQRTFTFSHVRFGQMDHIMTNRVVTDQFKTHKLPGSDHRAISARIRS